MLLLLLQCFTACTVLELLVFVSLLLAGMFPAGNVP
jgi:hypothetical protein